MHIDIKRISGTPGGGTHTPHTPAILYRTYTVGAGWERAGYHDNQSLAPLHKGAAANTKFSN